MIKQLEYSISDQVRQILELYMADQITKKQFDEQVNETNQVKQIARRLRREGKEINFCSISKVKASGREHFILSFEIVKP